MIKRGCEGWIILSIILISLSFSILIRSYFSIEWVSKLCAFLILAGVYLYTWIYFKMNSNRKKIHPVRKDFLLKKTLAYSFLLFASFTWTCLASLLGSNIVDYAFDMVLYFPLIIVFLVVHTYFVDRHYDEKEQNDENLKIGELIFGRKYLEIWHNKKILLKILLKSFFIPFMYTISLAALERIFSLSEISWSGFFYYSFMFGILFDVVIGTCGYLFATKLIDNQILDVESDWKGWFFCLICYPPFILILPSISDIKNTDFWSITSLPDSVIFLVLSIQAALWVVYWWSTVSFGLKFSNLTWRGLVNQGPYAWTKHPAYLSKNIYWWINVVAYMIFIQASSLEKIKVFSLMVLTSLFYYGRCKCEERHLSNFESYRIYDNNMKNLRWWQRSSMQ